MSQIKECNQFTIAHQLKHRLRIIVPGLHRDKERATILQILLLKRPAVNRVKIVPEINSVTIYFDSKQFPQTNLLNLLDCVLANFPEKSRESSKNNDKSRQRVAEMQYVVFGIKGMSCESCALFLEMVLSKETNNQQLSINYSSGLGAMRGYLGKTEIFKIIEDNGYQAYSLDAQAEAELLFAYNKRIPFIRKRSLILLGIPMVIFGFFLVR